jgi:hypothetical protein
MQQVQNPYLVPPTKLHRQNLTCGQLLEILIWSSELHSPVSTNNLTMAVGKGKSQSSYPKYTRNPDELVIFKVFASFLRISCLLNEICETWKSEKSYLSSHK